MAENSSFVTWLKRIFSIQTASLIIAIFAAYYTYSAYISSLPGQLTIEFPTIDEEKNKFSFSDAHDITRYFSIGFYEIPPVSINNGFIGGINNILLFPTLSNNTDKSLKDFSADIYIQYDGVMLNLIEESKGDKFFIDTTNFDIISEDMYSIHLSYNKNYLLANRRLPDPLQTLFLFKANEKISILGGEIKFDYHITYDGAKDPISFQYNAKLFYDENGFSDNFIANSVYKYLKSDVFANTLDRHNYADGEWVFISQNYVFRKFKHLSSDDFSQIENVSWSDLHD